MTRKQAGYVVGSKSGWRKGKVFWVAVFGVTGGVVYWLGSARADRASVEPSYTSTAEVVIRPHHRESGPDAQIAEFTPVPLPDTEEVRQEIGGEAAIRRAIERVAAAGSRRSVQHVRAGLRTSAQKHSASGELEISLACTDADAAYTVELVNALAEDFQRQCDTRWRHRTRGAYEEALEALRRAQEEYADAKAALEVFVERHLQQQTPQRGASAEEEESAPADDAAAEVTDWAPPPAVELQAQAAAVAEPPERVAVDNPQWVGLNERLMELRRHREQLLVDRTELHPEVRKAELDIAEVQRQLSVVPRRIPGQAPQPAAVPQLPAQRPLVEQPKRLGPSPAELAREAAAEPQQRRAELAKRHRDLVAAVDRAAALSAEATRAANRAWQEHTYLPVISLRLAKALDVRAGLPAADGSLMWMAVLAGVVAAAGVGMVATATTGMKPALATVGEAVEVLPQPLLGTIPETDLTGGPRAMRRQRLLRRTVVILVGLGLIVGWAGALIRVLG